VTRPRDDPRRLPLRARPPVPAALHLALACALLASPPAAFAAGADPAAVRCDNLRKDILAGTPADPGLRYRLGGDITVAAPALPAGWTIARCHADEVVFMRADEEKKLVLTASVSRATMAPWRDEPAFANAVRAMFQRANGPSPQHLTTDSIASTRVASHPCVDLRRSGTVSDDKDRAPDGSPADPLVTREVARVCHLQDPAHAGAAVLVVVKFSGAKDLATLGATADAFIAGVDLPAPATPASAAQRPLRR
jgi:hypothetical protein